MWARGFERAETPVCRCAPSRPPLAGTCWCSGCNQGFASNSSGCSNSTCAATYPSVCADSSSGASFWAPQTELPPITIGQITGGICFLLQFNCTASAVALSLAMLADEFAHPGSLSGWLGLCWPYQLNAQVTTYYYFDTWAQSSTYGSSDATTTCAFCAGNSTFTSLLSAAYLCTTNSCNSNFPSPLPPLPPPFRRRLRHCRHCLSAVQCQQDSQSRHTLTAALV